MSWRRSGFPGDIYLLSESDAERSQRQVGYGDFPTLHAGDAVARMFHSGDCFADYAVFRDGKRIQDWSGYDFIRSERTSNIWKHLTELPRTLVEREEHK